MVCSLLWVSVAQEQELYKEPFRPQYHFTPSENWMNDPNGLIYFDGEYHLFYQYNPFGKTWGHMSWGHAVSEDLVHWKHLPIALPEKKDRMAFSGCVVLDRNNSAGFSKNGEPTLVAVYTGYRQSDGWQAQFLAYSQDRGRTWTDPSNEPVLDISSTDFRDPNVIPYKGEWRMVVALPSERKVQFYASKDLKNWQYLSEFGPHGAVGGAWECPDLFPLQIEGEETTRWVLQVDLDRQGFAGGSGGQYFVGDFDGTSFTLDTPTPRRVFPDGKPVARDFSVEGDGQWQLEGGRCGSTRETVGLAVSKPFLLSEDWLNFQVRGGRHPETLEVRLRVDGESVHRSSGFNGSDFQPVAWNVSAWRGKMATLEVSDQTTDLWGYLEVREATLSDRPAPLSKDLARWLDYGPDYYAALSFHNLADRRVGLAWMNNWLYGQDLPTSPWRSAMSLPRELTLKRLNGVLELCQEPVKELAELRTTLDPKRKTWTPTHRPTSMELSPESGELHLRWSPGESTHLKWELLGLSYEIDLEKRELRFQRQDGQVDVHPDFFNRTVVPLTVSEGDWEIQMFYDRSSVELFTQHGSLCHTARTFPREPNSFQLEVSGDGGQLSLEGWGLTSIW